LRRFLIAVQFLTIIPVPYRFRATDEDLGRSMACFPLVGLLLGGILHGLSQAIVLIFPERIADLGCVVALVLLTGGLHLDGLADTTDAFFSRDGRQRMLEIMRESEIGPMGAAAIVFALLLKLELLSGLSHQIKRTTLILMPVVARWSVVFQAAMLPYARASQGLGAAFTRYAGSREAFLSTLFTLLIVLGLRQLRGLWSMAFALLVSLLFAQYTRQKTGGATGDTMGAGIEIAEIAALAAGYINL